VLLGIWGGEDEEGLYRRFYLRQPFSWASPAKSTALRGGERAEGEWAVSVRARLHQKLVQQPHQIFGEVIGGAASGVGGWFYKYYILLKLDFSVMTL